MLEFIIGFAVGAVAGPSVIAAWKKWRSSSDGTASTKGTTRPPGGGGGPGEPTP